MAISIGRCVVFALAGLAVVLPGTAAYGQDAQDTAPINDRIDLWNSRPPVPATVMTKYNNAKTIAIEFPRAYKDAVRQVLEMFISHFCKASQAELPPGHGVRSGAPPQDWRRAWRKFIVAELTVGTTRRFQQETTDILCPILVDTVTAYLDEKGNPFLEVRSGAMMILVQCPASPRAKVSALLRLMRMKTANQAMRFMAARELGRLKIRKAVPDLVKLLKVKNPVLQSAAARALGEIGDVDGLEPLLGLLSSVGDTTEGPASAAREALLDTIAGVKSIARMNTLDPKVQARVVAYLMRVVLSDPDRRVVVAAASAVKDITAHVESFSVLDREEELQAKIERLRVWWLEQKYAKDYYRKFFSTE